MTEQPKKMTVELLCEHNIKKDNALLKILTQALRLAGQDSDIVNDIEETIKDVKADLEWYTSGDAYKAMYTGDPDDDEDYDKYAPEVYTLNSLDLSSFDSPELEAGYQDALKRRKATFSPEFAKFADILDGVQGVM